MSRDDDKYISDALWEAQTQSAIHGKLELKAMMWTNKLGMGMGGGGVVAQMLVTFAEMRIMVSVCGVHVCVCVSACVYASVCV